MGSGQVGAVISFVYGADEFFYVLGKCLLNYGGLIGHGMYQSVVSVSETERTIATLGQQEQEDPQTIRKEQEVNETPSPWTDRPRDLPKSAPVPPQTMSQRPPQNASSQQVPLSAPPAPTRAKIDWSKWTPNTAGGKQDEQSESEKQEFQLREQVRSMKVNFEDDESVLDMADVAGLDSVKTALDEFACFFLYFPHLTRNLRQRSTTGILLFGPQGTGKTLLVKSFAKKYNLSVYDIRASAIMSKFVGESEKFVRALFKEVRANAPSVLLLDECDGLLCNPSADATQSHNYRLLQNEMKNQWSDLMYSRDEVIVIGVTNKPQDIDMDGFGRRLSLKLHVGLPNEQGCQSILKGSLDRVNHNVSDEEFKRLGTTCHERGLSGYDIDCLVEGILRKALRNLVLAKWFKWEDGIAYPCEESGEGAMEGPYSMVAAHVEDVSYRPFTVEDVMVAIQRTRATVDENMTQSHILFASKYATDN
jgi:vacuolar protein-sorting-associated protein 4